MSEQIGAWPKQRWAEPSRAVVVCDGHGNGCILYTEGPHFRSEMETNGRGLGDLWLDDTEHGIWVVVGRIVPITYPSSPNGPEEYDAELQADEFRRPTPEEWKAIVEGRTPWPDPHWEAFEHEDRLRADEESEQRAVLNDY